jgi:hypothetical protein
MACKWCIDIAYKDAIFNVVITPFRDMLDLSAIEGQLKDCLNLRLGVCCQSQDSQFPRKQLSLSRLVCLNGVAAE